MKSIFLLLYFLLVINFTYSQSIFGLPTMDPLEGIYLQPGTLTGLKIEKFPNGNYHFNKIIRINDVIVVSE